MVFNGRDWSVYQWHEKMFDGTDDLFEGLRKNSSWSKIIATMNGMVLFTKESQPVITDYYSLPESMMEESEVQLDAAKRELLEEVGLD